MRHDRIEPLEVPAFARLAALTLGGRTVAEYVDGAALPRELAPRPFLHPVRTAGGVVVTDRCPPDHRWHLGVGVAVQDVAGNNLWGGRTFVRGQGYVWRPDHGSMRHIGVEALPAPAPAGHLPAPAPAGHLPAPAGAGRVASPEAGVRGPGLRARLDWLGADGAPLLHETRWMRASWLPAAGAPAGAPDSSAATSPDGAPGPTAWVLDLAVRLTAAGTGAVELGSPATNGRPGGGYGGLFWRLPPLDAARVRTPDAEGEDAVHGSTARWLAVAGRVGGAAVTLVATRPGGAGVPADPWFVRLCGYPGFGPSLAVDRPVTVRPGVPVERWLRVAVVDGDIDPFVVGTAMDALGHERMAP